MSEAEGFPAVSTPSASILLLGSMPGLPSLAVCEYYGNPRNAFWRIMATLLEFDPDLPYSRRLAALKKNNIALWDVIGSCYREGSLDSAIKPDSVRVNDFAEFFSRHKKIDTVFFNGGKAEQLWRRHVAAQLDVELMTQRLPSTSPAYAAMPYSQKLEVWSKKLGYGHPPE